MIGLLNIPDNNTILKMTLTLSILMLLHKIYFSMTNNHRPFKESSMQT